MDQSARLARCKPEGMRPEEWACRLELAAAYRVFDWLGWAEMIFNHITLRVPGPDKYYLINPYGLWYSEVTATNLVKVNLAGEPVDGSPHLVNKAGFVIHSAVHAAREDAHCIIHTHTTATMAVCVKQDGLRHDNFYGAQLYGMVGYHDFEGITTDEAEQPRLVASLGANRILLLRNHGPLVVGPHLPEAFATCWTLQRACEVQAQADAMRGENTPVPQSVLDAIPGQAKFFRTTGPRRGQLMFDALLRRAGIRDEDLI